MNADGSNPHAVVEDKDLRMYEPAWTPDSRNILVARHSVATGLETPPPAGIWLYNRDGGKGLEIVSGKDEKGAEWPAVSSDGRYVYFQYAAGEPSSYAGHDDPLQGFFQVKRIELRTGDKEDVTSGQGAQQYRLSNGGAFAPEISPDGRWLTFAPAHSKRHDLLQRSQVRPAHRTLAPRSAIRIRARPHGPDRK